MNQQILLLGPVANWLRRGIAWYLVDTSNCQL